MRKIIDKKVYDTENAVLIASDRYWDGSNWDRCGRNTYLYKTKRNNYFLHFETNWQGEFDDIVAITEKEAIEQYERLKEKEMEFSEAFPDIQLEEA